MLIKTLIVYYVIKMGKYQGIFYHVISTNDVCITTYISQIVMILYYSHKATYRLVRVVQLTIRDKSHILMWYAFVIIH